MLVLNGNREDERLDWQKTAQAAARYLASNRNVFASTVLALGAYHHGSAKVVSVLLSMSQESKMRSFEPIFKNSQLGPYSREYIPQCLAAAYLYRKLQVAGVDQLPDLGATYAKIQNNVTVKSLSHRYHEALIENPDLNYADRIYCYASTGGYALVTGTEKYLKLVSRTKKDMEASRNRQPIFKLDSVNSHPSRSRAQQGKFTETVSRAEHLPNAEQFKEHSCDIAYVFQQGNSLAELAQMFAVDLHTILYHPANKKYKLRYPLQPQPGEIVVIPGLAPTTTILSSTLCTSSSGNRFCTREHDTLTQIAQEATKILRSQQVEKQGYSSAEVVTPQRILYWNHDLLPQDTDINDPLPAGIPLFIVSGFDLNGFGKMVGRR